MIGNQIKKIRTEQGMTQQNLADQLFVTAQAVSRWENGEVEPSLSTITKMAQIFNVTTDEILGIDTKEPEKQPEQTAQVFAKTEPKQIEKAVPKQPQRSVLGICEKCKRPIYKKEELIIKHASVGKYSPTQHIYYIHCIQCEEKAKAEHARLAASAAARLRKISFIYGGIGATVVLAIMITLIAAHIFNTPALITVGILAPISTYTLISCAVFQNNFIADIIVTKTFWILVLLLGVFILLIPLLVISIFLYPFALSKSIKHPEKSNFTM